MRLFRRRRARTGRDPLMCQEFVELVTDYLEGTLPPAERARMDAHLAGCDGCAGYLEDMRRLVGTLHETPEPPPDAETRETLLRAFRELRGDPGDGP
jgi:anti-sigma factor RsiW